MLTHKQVVAVALGAICHSRVLVYLLLPGSKCREI